MNEKLDVYYDDDFEEESEWTIISEFYKIIW